MDYSTPGFPVHHQILELAQTRVHWCQWCHPTILSSVIPFSSCPQSFPAWGYFSNESVLRIRWPKNWSFSFSISPSNKVKSQFFQWVNSQEYRICIMESIIPTSLGYCEVIWYMERTCHSVWLLAGLRGEREYMLPFSFVSTSIC